MADPLEQDATSVAAAPSITAVTSSKGGVGKSTITIALASEAAHRQLRTLVIDVDTQADASKRLLGSEESDDGLGVFRTFMDGDALSPIKTSTPNLWVCPAGERTQDLSDLLVQKIHKADPEDLASAYGAVAENVRAGVAAFDFVVVDCPPSEQSRTLIDFVFAMSTHLLLPTKVDDASADAVSRALTRLVKLARRGVAVADPIGILLNDCDVFGTKLRTAARSKFDHVSSIVRPFDNYIEHRSGPCTYSGEAGLTPRQYLAAAEAAERDGYQENGMSSRSAWAVNPARNFVNDFERVFDELWARLNEAGEAA